ncbi:hypothetical protein FraQA3DRAFT_2233 [Frankia sp. QA3]|nr:hypothetical protein [Frankia sp. QA3]EIV92640.1 hypothetical protein FraQA3DRAFT_2233 [Frankia sp. QA3]
MVESGDFAYAARLNDRAAVLLTEAGRTCDLGLLAAAIKLFRAAAALLDTAPPGPSRLGAGESSVGNGPEIGTEPLIAGTPRAREGELTDLRGAVWANLALALSRLFEWDGDTRALAEAVTTARRALAVTPPEHPAHPRRLTALGTVLLRRCEAVDDPVAEREAVAVLRRAVMTSAAADPGLVIRLSNLAAALLLWQRRAPDEPVLDEALAAARHACVLVGVAAVPPGAAAPSEFSRPAEVQGPHDGLGGADAVPGSGAAAAAAVDPAVDLARGLLIEALRMLSRRPGRSADATVALELARAALRDHSPGSAGWADAAAEIGMLARQLGEHAGDLDLLAEAVRRGRQALGATGGRESARAARLVNLTAALVTAYRWLGEETYAAEAEQAGQTALNLLPDRSPTRVPALFNLATVLLLRYERLGDAELLRRAVEYGGEAVALVPLGHAHRGPCLDVLASVLHARYRETRDPDLLADAVRTAREATASFSLDEVERAGWLSNLALILLSDFEQLRRVRPAGWHVQVHRQLGSHQRRVRLDARHPTPRTRRSPRETVTVPDDNVGQCLVGTKRRLVVSATERGGTHCRFSRRPLGGGRIPCCGATSPRPWRSCGQRPAVRTVPPWQPRRQNSRRSARSGPTRQARTPASRRPSRYGSASLRRSIGSARKRSSCPSTP